MIDSVSKKEQKSLVTIVIPFFNRDEYLSDAIDSVLSQTYDHWELVLIDDGSTDESVEIANKYISQMPGSILLFSHEGNSNRGASASRKLGIEKAAGEFVTFLDSDDVLLPDALEKELEAFSNNPEADAVCGTLKCWYSWSDKADYKDQDFIIDLMLEPGIIYQPPDLLLHNLKAGGRKPGITCVMLKTDFAREFGVFEEDYKYAWEDQVFWAKVSLHGSVFVTDSVLAKYRQHPASTCAVESQEGQDTPTMNIYLDWLEEYLRTEQFEDERINKAIAVFKRNVALESRVLWLKKFYRERLPLKTRYWIRNKWIGLKQMLSRPPHRHK